jgi:virulence factor Mce-like protein
VVIAILGVLAAIALRAPNGVPWVGYRTFYATVPDVGNLQTHNDVRMAGVRVGQILDERAENGQVRLKLQLAPSAGALPSDTTAAVRANGLLGQRYLQLTPGRSQQALADGAAIAPARLPETLGVADALQVFDTQTRGALGETIRGLGAGLVGRGLQLNDAIRVAPQAADDFNQAASAILSNPPATRGLLPAMAGAAAALDGARDGLTQMLAPTSRALSPFVDERPAVQDALAKAPPTLTDAQAGMQRGAQLLASVNTLALALSRTLPSAPGALRATTTLLRESPAPLQRAGALLAQARTAVAATLRITGGLAPVLPRLKQPLDRLLAPVQILGAHGCDIATFAASWASFLGFGVPGGGQIGPLGEIRAEALLTQPYADAGSAVHLPAALVDRNLYPAPCTYRGSTYSLTDPTH